MSYQIVKSLKVVTFEDGTACVIAGQSSNNVSPRDYTPAAGIFAESEAALRAQMAYWQMGGSWQFPREAALVKGYRYEDLDEKDRALVDEARASATHTLSNESAHKSIAYIDKCANLPDDDSNAWEKRYYTTPETQARLAVMKRLMAGEPVSVLQAEARQKAAKVSAVELTTTNIYELGESHWLRSQRGYTHFVGTEEGKDIVAVGKVNAERNTLEFSRLRLKPRDTPLRNLAEHRQLGAEEVADLDPDRASTHIDRALNLKGKEIEAHAQGLLLRRHETVMPFAPASGRAEDAAPGLALTRVALGSATGDWHGKTEKIWKTSNKGTARNYPWSVIRESGGCSSFGRWNGYVLNDAQLAAVAQGFAHDRQYNAPEIGGRMALLAVVLGGETDAKVGFSPDEPGVIRVGKESVHVVVTDPEATASEGAYSVSVVDAKGRTLASHENVSLHDFMPMAFLAVHQAVQVQKLEKSLAKTAAKKGVER